MITKGQKKLAHQMKDYALSNGCSSCRISIYSGTESTFEYRDTQLEQLQQSSQNQLSIALFVDGRYGSFSTNRIEAGELKKFIKNAIASTRYLAADAHRSLPAPDRYYKGVDAPDDCYDRQYETLSPDAKLQLAKAAVEEVYQSDPHIISVVGSYGDSEGFRYVIDSQGFEGEKAESSFYVSADVSLKGDGNARPESWWYHSALFWERLEKAGIGQKALARALRKLGQAKIKSGQYPMIVDNMNGSRLFSPLINAMNGESLAQKDSFLTDRLGQSIASTRLTVRDEPHLPQASGSRRFDYEGVATQPRTVIENGVLKTYFIDTYNAHRLQMEPTISGASILTFTPGNRDTDGLVASLDRGILVTGFNGGNCNSTTGDFSFGVEGFLIENGKLVKPISEMNITGNMLTLWASLADVGNDARDWSSWRIPSLLFDAVSFSGN
ncbi:MAG: TldD/PmbA family protein [Prevotellaceae bacterium]|jgi:PmbA protein|nr:TldD/PmbA family protein [Prevotellaceae bacterium]